MTEPAPKVDAVSLGRQLVDRARAMLPALRQRSEQANAERCVPVETMREMHEIGLFRVLQPKRYGGFELDPQVLYELEMTLAEGCMSSAWILAVAGAHPFQLALFDARAQDDVWKENSAALICSSYQPVGKVERVDGGFRLSGRWGFSSGCDHCQWVFLGALVPPTAPGGAPEMTTFMLPRSDYQIVRDWTVFGLQGTGSHSIVVERAFVPEYRTLTHLDAFRGSCRGLTVNSSALYRVPFAQVFFRAVSTPAIGALQGALDAFEAIAAKRVSTNTGRATKIDPYVLNAAARTQSAICEMKTVLTRTFDDMMATLRAGKQLPLQDRMRYRFESSQVVRRCAELCDDLMPLLGGRAIYMDSPVVRYWLDINAARAHVANDPFLMGASLGATYLGEAVNEIFV